MESERRSDDLIRMFLGGAKDFTPIMVSADFSALICPPCLKTVAEGGITLPLTTRSKTASPAHGEKILDAA